MGAKDRWAHGVQGELRQPHPRRFQGALLTGVSGVFAVALFVVWKGFAPRLGLGGIPIIVALGVLFGLALLGVERGKRMRAKSAATAIADDRRPPVLYLRSFESDSAPPLKENPYYRNRSFEEHVVLALKDAGPVVAVGSPAESESLPALGASRMFLRHNAWQREVDALINESALVVVHAGISSGVVWELWRAVLANRPERLIICLPVDRAKTWKRNRTAEERYQQFRAATAGVFPRPLPIYAAGSAFVFFLPDWTPQLLDFDWPPPWPTVVGQALGRLAKEFKPLVAQPKR